jgi:regulator of cell morphogenesis and NO signaling
MVDISTATLKEMVTDDFRVAAIFEKYSLDFCCRGGKTIEQACMDKAVNKDGVLSEVYELLQRDELPGDSFGVLSMSELTRHIITTHHSFVRKMVPILLTHTRKVATVHGVNHPEVVEIAAGFERVATDLQNHMMKEERVLFPYIEMLVNASNGTGSVQRPPFGTVRNPIRMMEAEHQAAGDELYEIRKLSSSYTPPADACTTFKVTYQELQEFERDLHQHVHLENNILFPKAISLEEELFLSSGHEVSKTL